MRTLRARWSLLRKLRALAADEDPGGALALDAARSSASRAGRGLWCCPNAIVLPAKGFRLVAAKRLCGLEKAFWLADLPPACEVEHEG